MNITVELVKQWGEFEAHHPGATIEDFSRHYLAMQEQKSEAEFPEGIIKRGIDGDLVFLIRRVAKLHMAYASIALEGSGISQMEEFGLLITLRLQPDLRKTDLIYANIQVLSSGANMLQRLIKKGLVLEYADQEDKRSKRLKLTPEGERVVNGCKERVIRLAKMLTADLTTDDKKLAIRLLAVIDKKYLSLFRKQKNKTFEEIYRENMGGAGDQPPEK